MRQFVPEQGVSSCSLFTQVPVAGEALDWAERLRFIKPRVSSEHWLRRLSEWLSGIGSEVLDGRGSTAMMAADADLRNAWTDAKLKQAHLLEITFTATEARSYGARVSSLSGSPKGLRVGPKLLAEVEYARSPRRRRSGHPIFKACGTICDGGL